MSKITIKDVAKRCNVSVSTVSRALNNNPEINENTKNFILQTISEIGYVPSATAIKLKRSNTNTIAVLIKGIDNPFFQPMFKILEHEIHSRSHSFLLYKVEENDDEIAMAQKLVNDEKPRGIIFLGGDFTHNYDLKQKELAKIQVPFVVASIINYHNSLSNCAYVGIDNIMQSEKLTDYLISKGHSKIALIGSRRNDISVGMARMQGYKNSFMKNGIEIDENLIFMADDEVEPYTFEYGYITAQKLFDMNSASSQVRHFSAIYCVSDSIAIGVLKKMQELGLYAPKDCAVVGFDGLKINEFLPQTITTIKQPIEQIAFESCRQLFKIIDKKRHRSNIILDAKLYLGQTS